MAIDSAVLVIPLLLIAVGAMVVWGFGWLVRHGGASATDEVVQDAVDSVLAVAFRAKPGRKQAVNGMTELKISRRLVLRFAAYLFFATLMTLLWLFLGSQVATLCVPAAVAFIKHGGEIATYKLHLYWNIRMAFGVMGFLVGLVIGEAAYILISPLIPA
jgi:hypothetical protein